MKTFGKKLMSLVLSLMLLVSLAAFMPVSAEGITGSVTVGSTTSALKFDGTDAFSPVNKLTFALPVTELAENAIALSEELKTAETQTWIARVLPTPILADGNVTIDFPAGYLAANTSYKITFSADVTGADAVDFVFTTTQDGNYYINDDFSRYPTTVPANGGAALAKFPLEEHAPWAGTPRSGWYQRINVVESNGKHVLRLFNPSESTAGANYEYMYVTYHNSYAPSMPAGTTSFTGVGEVAFAVSGNQSSIIELGGLVIAKDKENDSKYALYVRTSNGIVANSTTLDVSTKIAEFPALTETLANHTLKYVITTDCRASYKMNMLKVWLDGNEITLPESGIAMTFHSSAYVEGVLNFNGGAYSSANVFAVANRYNETDENGTVIKKPTTLEVQSFKYSLYEIPKSGITASKPSGTIDNIGTLTYTFDEPMNKDSVLSGVTLLEWNNQYDSSIAGTGNYQTMYQWNQRDIAEFASMSADGKVLTLSFDEGDLAANGGSYKVEFADTIVTAEGGTLKADAVKSYSYTTQQVASDNYWLYENFERYPVGMYPYNDRYHYSNLSPIDPSYGYIVGVSGIVSNGTDKGLRVQSSSCSTAAINYDTSFAKTVDNLPSVGVVELELDLVHNDNETSFFELGGTLVIRRDGTDSETGTNCVNTSTDKRSLINYGDTFGIYARTAGFGCNGDTAATETFSNMRRLGDAVTEDYNLLDGAKHTIKYVTRYENNPSTSGVAVIRKLLAVYVDGILVETTALPADGLLLSAHNSAGIFFNNSKLSTTTRAFGTASFKNGATAAYMTIYSLKSYVGEEVIESEAISGDSFTKTVTIKDYTGASFSAMSAFLATYSEDGKTLVDVKPATVTLSDSNKTATITGTATVAVGGSYKLILLNSETGLQPVRSAFTGNIQ